MAERAREKRGIAHAAGVAMALLAIAPQDQDPPPWIQPLISQCEELLLHRGPELRGEAALILASIGMPEHHTDILDISRDPSFEARIRGLVALGILAEPGAEARLGEVLEAGATRAGLDSAAAALSLGLLPESRPAHAVDEYLVRFRRSNYRRQRDVLASMLIGLAEDIPASRRTALRGLLEDAANKDELLRALLIKVLMPMPGGLESDEVEELLRSPEEAELHAVLLSLLESERPLSEDQLDQVARLAARDRSPQIRAAALDCLTLHRHLPALEMARAALDSDAPAEAAAAVRTAARLGGGAFVAELETRILNEETAAVQAAMLSAFTGFRSDDFRKGCAELALDPARDLAVRAQAAGVAAELGDARLGPGIQRLFLDAEDPATLTVLATALVRVTPRASLVADFYPPKSPEDLARLANRLQALAAAGHAEAFDLLSTALANDELDPMTKADLLRAWRLGNWPLLDRREIEMLPAALAALLR